MKRTGRRSDCPINFALQTFGDAWSLLVIRDLMFTDRRTYTDLLGAEEGIATNVLADRLKRLQALGLIRRRGTGRGATYGLTEKGLDLLPAMRREAMHHQRLRFRQPNECFVDPIRPQLRFPARFFALFSH